MNKNREKVAKVLDKAIGAFGGTTKVAEAMEVSKGTVSRWRSGSRPPSLDDFLTLCKLLHISPDQLVQLRPVDAEVVQKQLALILGRIARIEDKITMIDDTCTMLAGGLKLLEEMIVDLAVEENNVQTRHQ